MKLTFNTDRPYSKEGQIIQAEVYNSYQRDGVDYLELYTLVQISVLVVSEVNTNQGSDKNDTLRNSKPPN